MKKNYKVLIPILLFLGFIKVVPASSNQSISINVRIDVPNSYYISSASLDTGYTVPCLGDGYNIAGYMQVPSGLAINILGPFNTDKRSYCKIFDNTTKTDYNVYFAVYGLPIYFTYNGEQHSCYINQNIGTYYKSGLHASYAMLEGESTNFSLPCNGLVDGDTYQVVAANNSIIGASTGYINVRIPQPNSAMHVYFNVVESSLLTSEYLGKTYKMSCVGKTTNNYPNGYTITGTYQYPDDSTFLEIGVEGPFNGDNRDSCKLYDNTTTNTNNVYFTVESLPIFYTYKGKPHSCYINQGVGISYNVATKMANKLQGANSSTTLPCNGLVDGDTYKLTPGHQNGTSSSGYNIGDITISVPEN